MYSTAQKKGHTCSYLTHLGYKTLWNQKRMFYCHLGANKRLREMATLTLQFHMYSTVQKWGRPSYMQFSHSPITRECTSEPEAESNYHLIVNTCNVTTIKCE